MSTVTFRSVLGFALALTAACATNGPPRSAAIEAGGTIAESSVRSHMAFLASDALNGRESGSRDEWIAASYVGSQLQRWGIEPLGDSGGFVQQVSIERSETTAPPTLTYPGGKLTHGKEMIVAAIGGRRIAGPLHRYQDGVPVPPGSVILLPAANPPPAAATIAASIVISLERAERAGLPVVAAPPSSTTLSTRLCARPSRLAGKRTTSSPRSQPVRC
jgi:hypothetical protein